MSERIRLLSDRVQQQPASQVLRLQRSMAYLDSNEMELALADIQAAETLGDPVEAAGLLLLAGQPQDAMAYLTVAQEQLHAERPSSVNQALLETALRLQEESRQAMHRPCDDSAGPSCKKAAR